MLMQTGWIQASRRVTRRLTRRLAWDPTCLPLSLSLSIKNKQNLQVLKSRRQYNLFLENYPAFKGLISFFKTLFSHFWTSGSTLASQQYWGRKDQRLPGDNRHMPTDNCHHCTCSPCPSDLSKAWIIMQRLALPYCWARAIRLYVNTKFVSTYVFLAFTLENIIMLTPLNMNMVSVQYG